MLEQQSNASAASKAILIESAFKKDRIVGQMSVKKTAPIFAAHDALIQTPTKKKKEEEPEDQELLVDSDKSGDDKDSDEDEDEDSENEAETDLANQEKLKL